MDEPQKVEEHIDGHEEGGDEEVWKKRFSPILVFASFTSEGFGRKLDNLAAPSFEIPKIALYPLPSFECLYGPGDRKLMNWVLSV